MLTLPKALVVAALLAVCASGADTAVPLVVTGDRVCLRARPEGSSEVIHQVSSGCLLQGVGWTSNWVEVIPPAEASGWVSASLVSNGVVQASKVNVRAGPGINYPVLGTARQGEKLEVRSTEYGWMKVGLPADCRAWISTEFVKPAPQTQGSTPAGAAVPPKPVAHEAPSQLPDQPVKKDSSGKVPAGASATVTVERASVAAETPVVPATAPAVVLPAPSVPAPQIATNAVAVTATSAVSRTDAKLPEALRSYELESDVDQGRQALYRGTLEKCNWLLRRPAPYRLLTKHPRRGVLTLCHVSGDASLLAPMEGKRVAVSGREYRLKGVERPVVVYETVVEEAVSLTVDADPNIMGSGSR